MSQAVPASQGPVLAAVDFSSHSEAALVWAAETARRFAAPLLVLHVVHDPASAPSPYADPGEDRTRRMEETAGKLLTEFLATVREKHPVVGECRPLLVVGLPATRIVEVAQREGAQLVVVGSKGRTGLAHILLGSKAERVAQLCPMPVTIVSAAERDAR